MGNRRMIQGVLFFIIMIMVFIIGYAILSWPMELIVDNFTDLYSDMSDDFGWTHKETTNNVALSLVYMLAGAFGFGIVCLIIWLYAFGHKKEFERGNG